MDHIPTLRGSTTASHSVPYLSTISTANVDFEKFPLQQGWDRSRLEQGDFVQGHDQRTAASFLQTWLYFGMLSEVSTAGRCEPPKAEEFVETRGSSRLITSRSLDDFTRKRLRKLAGSSGKKKVEPLEKLDRCLSSARLVTERLWMLQKQGTGRCPLPFEVILSIMVLGCTIDSALIDFQLATPRRRWGLSEVAKDAMEQNGWCRRDLTLAATHLSELAMYCAMSLRRDGMGNHSECTEYACEVNQVDDSTYETKHRTANCNCQFWHVDEGRLQQIIRDDEIPYISLKRNTKSKDGEVLAIDATLKSFRNSKAEGPHNRMVIFSHVWSDGKSSCS